MEENKNSKGLIWLIIILIIVILGLIGFIVYDKVLSNDKEVIREATTTTTTQTVQNNKNDENILRRDNFVYKINNKEHQISYVYKYKDSADYYKNESADIDKDLAIENNEYVYHMVYLEILLNETKIENINIPLYYDTENINVDTLINKVDILSSDTINILKGTDKEYMVFTIEHKNLMIDGGTNPLIVNDTGKLIYTLEFEDNSSLWSEDKNSKFYLKDNESNYKPYIIEESKIYYLSFYNFYNDNMYVKENYITINNDKVEITEGPITIGNSAGAY